MECLILRLEAPLMSFGGVVVDQHHPVERFPSISMLTGLLSNVLGWQHQDTSRIAHLQVALRFAARWDREPELHVDYQTVDLGQAHLTDTGWTTRGKREDRGTGAATSATHIRLRHYWANGCCTVALTVASADSPSLEDLEHALRMPARPIFIGRKSCLPATPILRGRRNVPTLRDALAQEPLDSPLQRQHRVPACWPIEDGIEGGEETEVYDVRDWPNQMHVGSRRHVQGIIEVLG